MPKPLERGWMPVWSFSGIFSTSEEMRNIIYQMLKNVLEQLHIDEEDWYDLKLILQELCSNALEHGEKPVELQASICACDNCLHILISDSGQGFCPMNCSPPSADEERGRGLHIVEALARKVAFNSSANKVLVSLNISEIV